MTNFEEATPTPPYICSWRRRPSEAVSADKRTILEQAHSDRGRLIFSASFRRLMKKTQVFALESEVVRTRLTHSLEVAHVGTYIVDKIFLQLKRIDETNKTGALKQWGGFDENYKLAIRSFVETACLAHDIGNPPFGHFGEKAICNWFIKNQNSTWYKNATKEKDYAKYDFVGFDGNKQGFRILTRLQRNLDDDYGLNLTATQLASTIKYPTLNVNKPKKCSYFQSEASIKDEIWSHLELKKRQRHPLSIIMEAADDIAYCISDLEDASEKELIATSDLKAVLGEEHFNGSISRGFTKARTKLTNKLVDDAADQFVNLLRDDKHCEQKSLLDDSKGTLFETKSLAQKNIYSSPLVLANEITGFKVIQGLLDHFVPLLEMESNDFICLVQVFERKESIYQSLTKDIVKKCTAEPGLLALLPRKHIATYLSSVSDGEFLEIFHRIHLILDFIAGMTDDYALKCYKLLSGQTIYE